MNLVFNNLFGKIVVSEAVPLAAPAAAVSSKRGGCSACLLRIRVLKHFELKVQHLMGVGVEYFNSVIFAAKRFLSVEISLAIVDTNEI